MSYLRLNQLIDADGEVDSDDLDKANDIIESLLITRENSIPGSRAFGLSQLFVGMPVPDAINMISVELAEKMDIYLPDCELHDIKSEIDDDQTIALNIYIGRR